VAAPVQKNTGQFTTTSWNVTLGATSSASNTLVVIIAGNTTVNTPASWTLRTSQVNNMGHYWFERAGAALSSIAFTSAAGAGTWSIFELDNATYVSATGANTTGAATTYVTPNHTPTAGDRNVLASIGSSGSGGSVKTTSGWTNSYVEETDDSIATTDMPMQGIARLEYTAGGVSATSTTATFSSTTGMSARTALIGSYSTVIGGGGAPAVPPILIMQPRRA
jgi:hypothetical protein